MLKILILFLTSIILFAKNNPLQVVKREVAKKYKEIDFDKAITICNEQINKNPKEPLWYYWLGTTLNERHFENGKSIPEINWQESVKASNAFENVLELDPDYYKEINLLDPYTSLSSIWGALAFKYKFLGNPDSMKIAFEEGEKRGAFNKAVVGFCKNVLNSAAKDSYLFINGDNYTFNFLYLQEYKNIRKDVVIIDLGLANSNWYTKLLINNDIIDKNIYDKPISEVTFLPFKDTTEIVNLLYGKKIMWDVKPKRNFLTKSNLILKYIVENKADKEEIYFPPFYDKESLIGLEKYLLDQGTILQLSNKEANTIGDAFEDNFKSSEFKYLEDKSYLNSYDAAILNDFYRYQLMRLIHSKIIEKDINGMMETYNFYLEWIKNKHFTSSSNEIDDYIARIKQIAEEIKKTIDENRR